MAASRNSFTFYQPSKCKIAAMIFQDDSAVIEPRRGRLEESLPSMALLVFTTLDMELLEEHGRLQSTRHNRTLYLSRLCSCVYDEHPVVLVGPMIGAPQTILVLERLIALGVRQVLAFGWCGSLQPHVNIGDLVLPLGSFSEEGTSAHYPLQESNPGPSPAMIRRLEDNLSSPQRKIHKGRVWTTDAPFRETKAKVHQYQMDGLLAVDMETSALFTLAHYRGIQLAQVLVVSDELDTFKWVHGFRSSKFKEARRWVAEQIFKGFMPGSLSDSHQRFSLSDGKKPRGSKNGAPA